MYFFGIDRGKEQAKVRLLILRKNQKQSDFHDPKKGVAMGMDC
jgi:hypothetical protein